MILSFLVALTATPATLPATLAKARCGDVVTLAPGDYGAVVAPRLSCGEADRLEIKAPGATMTSLTVRATTGVNVRGGTVAGAGGGAAATVEVARWVRIAGMILSGARVGINVVRSTDVDVIGNRFDGIRSDGVNMTMAQRVRIIGNACVDFRPILSTYAADGRLLVDGDHPDCIQGWSTKGTASLADVLIAGNTADGYMQGVWLGNPGQGGYDRITVRDNDFRIGAYNGVVVQEGRSTVIRDNRLLPTPGARLLGGNRGLIWPWVQMTGTGVACGNVVAPLASRYGTEACK